MSFTTNFPTSLPAAFTLRSGTTSLYSFNRAPSLLLKKVSSLAQAAACGGVFIIDTAGRWVMLSGKALESALTSRGVQGLVKVAPQQLDLQFRQANIHPLKRHAGNWQLAGTTWSHFVTGRPSTAAAVDFLTGQCLVMGVVTKAHGTGVGMSPEESASVAAGTADAGTVALYNSLFTVSEYMPASRDYLATCFGVTMHPYTRNFLTATSAARAQLVYDHFKRDQWVLYSQIELGSARAYFSSNKDKILAAWQEMGAPADALQYYQSSFSEALAAHYETDAQLSAQIPFVGGTTSATAGEDVRVVRSTPVTQLPEQDVSGRGLGSQYETTLQYPNGIPPVPAAGAEDTGMQWTTDELPASQNSLVADFGFDDSYPRFRLPAVESWTVDLQSSPRTYEMSPNVLVSIRELLATVSPSAALGLSAAVGTIKANDVVSGYEDYMAQRQPLLATTSGDYNSVKQSKVGMIKGPVNPFLGNLARHVKAFGDTWDRAALAAAEQ